MSSIAYRPDIDGLRAIAVLSVVLFHLEPSYLPGGFLGVDVFFVISGFLITKIIITERLKNTFSYTSFYMRRAKRILPPLFFVLLLTAVGAYIIMLPTDFYKFGISLASVLVFLSNVQYAFRTGDYFSGDSSEWPLLHTWSLAVEEQYYFILPVLILLLLNTKNKRIIAAFCIIGILSFIIAEAMSRSKGLGGMSYYLIITRMGELLIGSIIAAAQVQNNMRPWRSQAIAIVAAITIFTMFFVIDKNWVFPGLIAIPLCVSVAAIINSNGTLINKALSNRYLAAVGLLSYSLYLVHWPVLALARYIFNVERGQHSLDLKIQLLLIVLIGIVSVISYFFIEKPCRQVKTSAKKVFGLYFILPSVLLAGLSLAIIMQSGMPQRFTTGTVNAEYQFSHIDKNRCPSIVSIGCVAGQKDADQKIILFGNSHAEHYFEYIALYAEEYAYGVELYATGGCELSASTGKCKAVRDAFMETLSPNDIVIIAYRWDLTIRKSQEMEYLEKLLDSLAHSQKTVIVLSQPPVLNFNPSKLSNCERLNFKCDTVVDFISSYPEYNNIVKSLVEEKGAVFLDPYESLSDKFQVKKGEMSLYSDFDHLSVYGAKWLYENRNDTLGQILREISH